MASGQRRLRQRAAGVGSRLNPFRSRLFLLLTLLFLTLALAAQAHPRGQAAPAPDLSARPFLFRRGDSASPDDEPVVSLLAVGDVMPGRGVPATEDPLRLSAPWLRDADLTFGNLEAVLAPQGAPRPSTIQGHRRIVLEAPAVATTWLRSAGFDLLSLANNHSLDYGPSGLAHTVQLLQEAGITPLGASRDSTHDALIREVRGVRLAFLAFNAVPDPDPPIAPGDWQAARWDEEQALAATRQAAQEAHAVIVSLHWGEEYALRSAPWQRAAAQALAQAGADLIIGHHPHVVQEWATYQPGAFAAFSLGNFLFDQNGPHTGEGLALRAQFDRQGLRAVQALPLHAGLQPQPMSLTQARPLLARIAPPMPRQAFACDQDGCRPLTDAPPADGQSEGLFWSGAIDLTGDGQPELVRRAAQRLHIYEGDREVWVSPSNWRVVDVALGDPNDDGRGELLVALWQHDAEGHERSQPFIVGYREGQYKVIWGGRPVADPILEVAIGDVDGDGDQELLVLEQVGEEARLALWRWQGWNFSLFWRSASGAYTDLRLAPGPEGSWLPVISAG